MLLVDNDRNVIVILAGRPDDPDWDAVVAEGVRVMEEVRRAGYTKGVWKAGDTSSRRGNFVAVASGVSFGGGQRVRLLNYYAASTAHLPPASRESRPRCCPSAPHPAAAIEQVPQAPRRISIKCICLICTEAVRALRYYIQVPIPTPQRPPTQLFQ